MATQHFKRNLLLNLYREGKKILPACFLLLLKRDKNVWHLQPISSVWKPLAFLPVTLSKSGWSQEGLLSIKLVDVVEFQQSYSKPQKMMLSKCCTQYVKNSEDPAVPQDWKRSILIPIPEKGSTKECSNNKTLHSSPVLVRSCLISCMLGFSIIQTKNFQTFKLGLEKAEEPEIKLATFVGSQRKKRNSRKKQLPLFH